jgi:hypothetical protein
MHNTTIPRIEVPSTEDFEHEWLRKQRPVIIEGLFRGQPLERLYDAEQALKELGHIKIGVRAEYFGEWMAGRPYESSYQRTMTYSEYLSFLKENPSTTKMCTEVAVPVVLAEMFDLPDYCGIIEDPGSIQGFIYLGGQGNFAHCHFDGDHRTVLFHQVWGRKRVVLIPPKSGNKLNPVSNFATVCLEEMSDADRASFLHHAEGFECILEPGETLHMPALWWHHLEYIEDSFSFNLRFGCPEQCRPLAEFHLDHRIQLLGAHLYPKKKLSTVEQDAVQQMKRAHESTGYKSEQERRLHIGGLAEELCHALGLGDHLRTYWVPQDEKKEAMMRYQGQKRAK